MFSASPKRGRGGIRTHGNLSATAVFKTASINHSDTLPCGTMKSLPSRHHRKQTESNPSSRILRPEKSLRFPEGLDEAVDFVGRPGLSNHSASTCTSTSRNARTSLFGSRTTQFLLVAFLVPKFHLGTRKPRYDNYLEQLFRKSSLYESSVS